MGIERVNIGTAPMDQNAHNLREGMDLINANFEYLDKIKVGVIDISRLFIDLDNNKIVFIENNADLTLTDTLPADFNCVLKIRESVTATCNILAGSGVTLEPANPILETGKMCSIVRFPNSNIFVISGEI